MVDWRKRARGNARAIVMELEENYTYLRTVAFDGVPLEKVIQYLSIAEYKRLAHGGYMGKSYELEIKFGNHLTKYSTFGRGYVSE